MQYLKIQNIQLIHVSLSYLRYVKANWDNSRLATNCCQMVKKDNIGWCGKLR